jgi:ribonuclease BN (tRNA processing enzyme)
VRAVEPRERGRIMAGDFELSWTATDHTPEALAWRVDLADGASVTYSGDSGDTQALARLARETELFVCECSFPDDRAVAHHLTPSSAGRLARDAGCERLLLTHFYPEMDPEAARRGAAREFSGAIELARDGSRHRLHGRTTVTRA